MGALHIFISMALWSVCHYLVSVTCDWMDAILFFESQRQDPNENLNSAAVGPGGSWFAAHACGAAGSWFLSVYLKLDLCIMV